MVTPGKGSPDNHPGAGDYASVSTRLRKPWKKKNASKQSKPGSQETAHSACCKAFHLPSLEESKMLRARTRTPCSQQ